nr:hypothetical protein [Tanacetum cinerariifolium]
HLAGSVPLAPPGRTDLGPGRKLHGCAAGGAALRAVLAGYLWRISTHVRVFVWGQRYVGAAERGGGTAVAPQLGHLRRHAVVAGRGRHHGGFPHGARRPAAYHEPASAAGLHRLCGHQPCAGAGTERVLAVSGHVHFGHLLADCHDQLQYHCAVARAQVGAGARAPADWPAFHEAAQQLTRLRLRDGALRAGVFADVAEPSRITEFFYVATWGEHLRQHRRFTRDDQAVEAQ